MSDDWDSRVASVWASAAASTPAAVLGRIDVLVSERAPGDAKALFEAASARDYADRESEAESLYRRALELGLPQPQRGRAVIQLASTLRNLRRPDEAIAVLQEGFVDNEDHPLADSARAFLALCLVDSGDERAAVAVALDALADHLPEYTHAVRAYAADLLTR